MRLTRLSLTDFRGYPEAELHPDPGLTIVAGPERRGQDQPVGGGPRRHHRPIAPRCGRPRAGAPRTAVRKGAPGPGCRRRRRTRDGAIGDRAGDSGRDCARRGPQAADRQRRAAPRVVCERDRTIGSLPAGGDAAAHRLAGRAAALPRRDPGAARSPGGPRPGRAGAGPRAAERPAARHPPRGGDGRRPGLLGRAAGPGRRPGHGRAAAAGERAGGADPRPPRRGGAVGRGRCQRGAHLSRHAEGCLAGPAGRRGRPGSAAARLPAADRRRAPEGDVERGQPDRARSATTCGWRWAVGTWPRTPAAGSSAPSSWP